MNFFASHVLHCTPLSPIHIGCGDDYLPTEYVQDGDWLLAFDPTRLALAGQERAELVGLLTDGNAAGIPAKLRGFYAHRVEAVRAIARGRVRLLAQLGNQAEIARTAFAAIDHAAYLPGSSLKGAVRTAIVDDLVHDGRTIPRFRFADEMEELVIGGKFATSFLHLLRFSDSTGAAATQVCAQVNRYKKSNKPPKAHLESLVEVVAPMQSAAWRATVERWDNPAALGCRFDDRKMPNFDAPTPTQLAQAVNRFSRREFLRETEEPNIRGAVARPWLMAMRQILTAVDVANPRAFVVRVGKHCGAECLTVEGLRQIRMVGRDRPPEPEAHTVWLAANAKGQQTDLLPFGWLLCEFGAPDPGLGAIVADCAAALAPPPAAQSVAAPPPAPALSAVDAMAMPATNLGRSLYNLATELRAFAASGRRLRDRDNAFASIDSRLGNGMRGDPTEVAYAVWVARTFGQPAVHDVVWQGWCKKYPRLAESPNS
ncbi:MAG: type III-A CRISPR-associated RAMP protein Csm5 [Deltaproteobacteria bacterium]|nr:type III-A CRISPR-associated RAMP protein Csm5 [Deltaproteobacteria bacterium]